VETAAANLALARNRYEHLRSGGAPAAAVRTAECTVFGAEEVLTLARAEASGEAEALRQKYRQAEIQVMRLGETFVAAWPGEFFVEYGLEIKRRAPGRAFVVTMANGELQGYIVTQEAEAARGYEAQMSLFPAAAGSQFVEATLALLKSLP
jgi:neutral ceramidase